eukprot:scaffold14069_cov126-Isochrysis_galbana.AAC.2
MALSSAIRPTPCQPPDGAWSPHGRGSVTVAAGETSLGRDEPPPPPNNNKTGAGVESRRRVVLRTGGWRGPLHPDACMPCSGLHAPLLYMHGAQHQAFLCS